jgi:hypothetical protein
MLKGFSVLELAIGGSLVTSLLFVFVPAFVSNLHASKLAEPLDGLDQLSSAALLLAAGAPPLLALPSSAPRTPKQVPSGVRVVDAPSTWDHATWKLLGFRIEGPHSFSFSFDSTQGEGAATFTARSHGDLDGDGELSEFSVYGEVERDGEPEVYPVRIVREVE